MSNLKRDIKRMKDRRQRKERHQKGEYNFLEVALMFIVALLLIDGLYFIFWSLSCQTPPDSFHFGVIIESIIKIIKQKI